MARILNSVLISVLAFFGLLAAFALSGLRGSGSEGSPPAGQAGHVSIRALRTAWGPDGSGTQVVATLVLHNPGPGPAEAARATLHAEVDGATFAKDTFRPGKAIPPGADAEVRLTADLGDGFAPRFWAAHVAEGGSSRMALRGEVVVVEGKVERHLPFEWESSWDGDVAAAVDALADCPRAGSPVCIESATASWDGGDLRATLRVRNDGPAGLVVAGGESALSFGGTAVARGGPERTDLPAGAATPVALTFSFDDGALRDWWPRHVRACESSPVQASLVLRFQEADGWEAGTASWQGPALPWPGAFLCGGAGGGGGGA